METKLCWHDLCDEEQNVLMKIITTKLHGILDYIVGLLHIVGPALLGLGYNSYQTIVPLCLGIIIIAYSLITDYELSLRSVIPMKRHLILDVTGALVLFMIPWTPGFPETFKTPYLLVAVFEILVVMLSKQERPSTFEKRRRDFFNSVKELN